MELSVNNLGMVWETVYGARTKAYEIGLILHIAVDTLDSIDERYDDSSDKLREVMKTWLRTASKPTWQDILDALKSHVVGQPKLASDIEAKNCTIAETGQASGLIMPAEVQQPQLATRDTEVHTLQQALQDSRELRIKDQQLQDSKRHIHTLEQELRNSQRQIKELTHRVEEKTQQLQGIEKDLLRCEQTIREHRAANDQLKRRLQQVQQQVEEKQHATEERERRVRELTQQLQVTRQKAIRDMRWQEEPKAPVNMYSGSVAADSNMAYFNGHSSTTVYSYNLDTREWRRLPDTPYTHSTLVVVHHLLTMVGGQISGAATDSLLSLMGVRDKKWLPNLPAMPTKRYFTAVVSNGRSLIVAGGREQNRHSLATVEVLDTDTWQWSIASSLTHPFSDATISICGEKLYMLGGFDQSGQITNCVLSCSVPELLQSCQPQPLTGKQQTAPANKSTIWRHEADAPHYLSSCATLSGQLVVVGGHKGGKDTSAIIGYNEITDSWEAMGDMPTARCRALVAIFNGKMMVVGGGVLTGTDVVEILC